MFFTPMSWVPAFQTPLFVFFLHFIFLCSAISFVFLSSVFIHSFVFYSPIPNRPLIIRINLHFTKDAVKSFGFRIPSYVHRPYHKWTGHTKEELFQCLFRTFKSASITTIVSQTRKESTVFVAYFNLFWRYIYKCQLYKKNRLSHL